ncbi:MAG: hypothetical protein ACRCTI_07250 [Beijerinckiaceae bacterium]
MNDATDVEYQPRRRWYEDPRPPVFVVLEVKTDGGDVRRNSIRALAAEAVNETGHTLGEFHMNIAALEGMVSDPRTLARYRAHNDAWAAITQDAQRAGVVIPHFIAWVQGLPGQPVAVGTPLAQLALWMESYMRRFSKHVFYRGPFEGEPLFAGGGVDLPSLVMGITGLHYRKAVEYLLPAEWRDNRVETHKPRDDARMHAALFRTMMKARVERAAGLGS